MDYQQQPHRYMRPPPPPPPPHAPPHAPPPAADPYQRQPPPPPPWGNYSTTTQQFQYQQPPPQSQHSPSPPPPQWLSPPEHTHYSAPPPPPPHYPAHQPPPYPAHHPHYPPPHQFPPRPPPVPQSYSQEWGSGSWSHPQSWEYPTNNNEEDWEAKARAWAAAKSATDNQHPPPQFAPAGRPEGQNHYNNQYSQPIDPQFHTPMPPASSYSPYPVGTGHPNRSGAGHLQESQYISSEQASYATDVHAPYAARDSTASFPQQENSSISPLVHQQEVPSSYSSVAGNGAGDRYEKFNSSSTMPGASGLHHHVQPLPSSGGRSGWMEEHHHLHGSRPAEAMADPSNQPLNFAPHFNRDLDPHSQPNYSHSTGDPLRGDPVGVSPSYSWAPFSAPGVVYPPVRPKIPLEQQIDHQIAMPPPASGHSTSLFPTGPGFQPSVPMIGANFGVGPGVAPHPLAFSADSYGVSNVSDRPKKASVPNWLREEIIKNKAAITSSAPELPREDSESFEEDNDDRKGDQADRSIDSSRSTEDENEDEEVEAARTAAINQEIKRVLTEVLLKVTDELFDEIATKVLKEDDLPVEVDSDIGLSNHRVLPPTQAVLTPKASAKILIPTKGQEVDLHGASEKSSSGSPGDILGLGRYASDEEDDDIQSSGKLNSKESSAHAQSSSSKDLEDHSVLRSGSSREATDVKSGDPLKLETDGTGSKSPVIATANSSIPNAQLNDTEAAKELVPSDGQNSFKRSTGMEDDLHRGSDRSKSNKSVTEKAERRSGSLEAIKSGNDDYRIRDFGHRSDKNDRHENKTNFTGKGHKDSESAKERLEKKGDEENRRHEERHARAETKYHNGSKDKGMDKGSKTGEKAKDSESRKRSSPSDDKGRTSERGRDKREDTDEKRQDKTKDEKKERSRHKNGNDSGRHKRRRSSSIGARGRESKDNSVVGLANDYSDESSDDSKRKSRHSKRHKSPSPIRSRKRQVSRSPHSKHSKRRHSPYSSLETTRGRRSPSRSRSRSPVRRRR